MFGFKLKKNMLSSIILAFTLVVFAPLYAKDMTIMTELDKLIAKVNYQKICHEKIKTLNSLFKQPLGDDKLYWEKGDIARIYFYCESKYDISMNQKQRRLSEIWDMKDPVSIKECKREKANKANLLESNQYITKRC